MYDCFFVKTGPAMMHRHDVMYWKFSNVHLRLPGLILSLLPPAFIQQPTLPHYRKLLTVTHILIFQIACKIMSRECDFAGPVSEKSNCILLLLIIINNVIAGIVEMDSMETVESESYKNYG